MREIKFRAWDKEDKEMFRVIMLAGDTEKPDELLVSGRGGTIRGSILMQYTGLKDKNGKEGCCEDIVKFTKSYSKGYGKKEVKEFTGIIKENKHFHSCIMVGKTEFHIDNLLKSEIIGNIYENKELLKDS